MTRAALTVQDTGTGGRNGRRQATTGRTAATNLDGTWAAAAIATAPTGPAGRIVRPVLRGTATAAAGGGLADGGSRAATAIAARLTRRLAVRAGRAVRCVLGAADAAGAGRNFAYPVPSAADSAARLTVVYVRLQVLAAVGAAREARAARHVAVGGADAVATHAVGCAWAGADVAARSAVGRAGRCVGANAVAARLTRRAAECVAADA